jgi:hypothetical protein
MAKSTFLEMCKVVARECGQPGTGPIAVTGNSGIMDQIVRWVQTADIETQSRWLDWDFLHVDSWSDTTTIGDATYAAPADIGAWDVDSFYLDYNTASYKKLVKVDYNTWRSTMRNGVLTNQRPDFVVIKPDQSLILHSPPDDAYLLTGEYWKRPVKMTLAADTSTIPEEYERVIIARAKMYYAEFDAAQEIMANASVEYDDLLDKLEAKYLPSTHPARRLTDAEPLVVRIL